jgi:hypothetical protein
MGTMVITKLPEQAIMGMVRSLREGSGYALVALGKIFKHG